MINYREILRRLLKYIVLVLIAGSCIYVIPNNKIKNNEIIYISLIIGMVFCLLDIITPSIQIIVKNEDENEIKNEDENEIKYEE